MFQSLAAKSHVSTYPLALTIRMGLAQVPDRTKNATKVLITVSDKEIGFLTRVFVPFMACVHRPGR